MTNRKTTSKPNGNGSNRPTHTEYLVQERSEDQKAAWRAIGAGWQNKDGQGFGLKYDGSLMLVTDEDGTDTLCLVRQTPDIKTQTRIAHIKVHEDGARELIFEGQRILRKRRNNNDGTEGL